MDRLQRRTPRFEYRTIRGLRHRLTWWGEPSPSPIVLLHGFLDTSETWQFVVDALPDDWSFVAPDWRGFGDTEWAPGGYWFPDYFADLEVLLDTLTPDARARVVGHSMGGNVASIYAGIRPQRLAWFANLEGVGLRRTVPTEALGLYAEWLDELKSPPAQRVYESYAQLATVLRSRNPRLTQARAEFVARAWSRETADGRIELRADPAHRMRNPVLYRREEAEAIWGKIDIPVLLLLGELSNLKAHLGADGAADDFGSKFRDVRLQTLPGVGHMMHHEDPQAVADQLVRFLREVE